jgi:protocatechuate 3,4-dioxygenase beta subunit
MKLPIIIALTLLAAQSQSPTGVIEGRVIRSGTREPIANVLITLNAPVPASALSNLAPDVAARLANQISALNEDGIRGGLTQDVIDNAIENTRRNVIAGTSRPVTALTDGSGHFSFRELPPGRYTVRAELDGYFAAPLNGTSPAALTKTINLQEGKTNPPEDLVMVKGSVVAGRVRDPNGQPISGMNVAVYRVTYSNGRKMWSIFNQKPTDDRGEFRIYWLFPGEYYVGVIPRAPGAIPGPQDSWARTFYPGTTDPGTAMPVEIKDGNEVTGTDITIQTVSAGTFKISGVAINTAARPNPATGVIDRSISSFVLSPREPGVLDSVNLPSVANALPTASRGNGEFELRNIRPGAYDLYPVAPVITDTVAAAPGTVAAGTTLPAAGTFTSVQIIGGTVVTSVNSGPGGQVTTRRQPTGRVPVEVNRDIADIRVAVNLGAPLSGEVLVNGTGGSAIKRESIRLILRSLDTTPASYVSLIGIISVDAAGKFTAASVPEARYTFQISGLPATAYVADIRQGGTSVMDNGFVHDQSGTPVQIVVDANGGTLQGTVVNADGKPAANATVVLVPPQARRQNALLYKNVTTNETGNFTVRGVSPGPYTIFAWESVLPTAWQNAEFLSKYEARGQQINLSATSVGEVQLNVIP